MYKKIMKSPDNPQVIFKLVCLADATVIHRRGCGLDGPRIWGLELRVDRDMNGPSIPRVARRGHLTACARFYRFFFIDIE